MIARRLTSLVIGLLVLDLTRAGGDRACVDRARDVVATTSVPDEVGQHHVAGMGVPGDATHEQSSEIPTIPLCCVSLASCAIAWTTVRSTEQIDVATEGRGIPSASLRTPATGMKAPDPPPPKA